MKIFLYFLIFSSFFLNVKANDPMWEIRSKHIEGSKFYTWSGRYSNSGVGEWSAVYLCKSEDQHAIKNHEGCLLYDIKKNGRVIEIRWEEEKRKYLLSKGLLKNDSSSKTVKSNFNKNELISYFKQFERDESLVYYFFSYTSANNIYYGYASPVKDNNGRVKFFFGSARSVNFVTGNENNDCNINSRQTTNRAPWKGEFEMFCPSNAQENVKGTWIQDSVNDPGIGSGFNKSGSQVSVFFAPKPQTIINSINSFDFEKTQIAKKPEKKSTETINEILNKPCGKEDQNTPCSAVVINVASKKLFESKYSYSIRQAYNRAMSKCKKTTGNDDLCVFWILGGKRVGHLDTRTASIDPKTVNDSGLIVVKKPKIKDAQSKDIDSSLITIGSGSGFYINNKGYALTNNHVIDICKQSIAIIDGKETLFRVIATDKTNDVAVLKTNYKSRNFIKINEDGAKLGENVIAVGYPLAGRLSDSVKITRGIVSSLSGLDNNIGQIQIDAALQPGNSGGPVLNENGELVGIASAGLNKLLMAKEAKYIPENVNFAVASPIVVNILKSKKVKYTTPGMFGGSFSNTELAELGDSSTIQLFCRNTRAEYARLKKSKQYSQVLLDID